MFEHFISINVNIERLLYGLRTTNLEKLTILFQKSIDINILEQVFGRLLSLTVIW